jgi:hypothetical protein
MANPPRTHEASLDVAVEDVTFRSADGRFSVVSGTRVDDEERLTIVGDLG